MSTSAGDPPRIAIIGTGITGLLIAQGLKKNGFNIVIFERLPSLDAKPRDWSIIIHWAMPVMTKLLSEAVLNNLPAAMCNPYLPEEDINLTLPIYNGGTGEQLIKMQLPGAKRVSRRKLRHVIVAGLEDDIRWGKTLTGLTQPEAGTGPMRLTFADGETYDADYVLGADGPDSKVRQELIGAEASRPSPSGITISFALPYYKDAAIAQKFYDLHPVASLIFHTPVMGGLGVIDIPDKDDMTTWRNWWVLMWRGTSGNGLRGKEALEHMKEKGRTGGVSQTFMSLVEATPEDTACTVDEMRYWTPVPWTKYPGRVTLAGDAAHCMLPYRGQGLNQAIIDASNYVDALLKIRAEPGTRDAVMAAYDAELVDRGAKAVKSVLADAEQSLNEGAVQNMIETWTKMGFTSEVSPR